MNAVELEVMPEQDETIDVDYSTTAWFVGTDGDLGAAYALLKHPRMVLEVLESEHLVRDAIVLQQLHSRLATEVQLHQDNERTTRSEWSTMALVDAVISALAMEKLSRSPCLIVLEDEVIDATTELLTSRAGQENLGLLTLWETCLGSLLSVAKTSSPESNYSSCGTYSSVAQAKALVAATIAFHRVVDYEHEFASSRAHSLVHVLWTDEITNLVNATVVTPHEEWVRLAFAADLQHVFRCTPKWQQCEILLFGSSMSKFGSMTSDLDLCLRWHKDVNPQEANTIISRYEPVRHCQTSGFESSSESTLLLRELLEKAYMGVQNVANQLSTLQKKTKLNDVAIKQQVGLVAHWKALVVAIVDALHLSNDKQDDKNVRAGTTKQQQAMDIAAEYHAKVLPTPNSPPKHRKAIKAQKPCATDVYPAAGILEQCGCWIQKVLVNVRIPVVRFTHIASGFQGDLTFDNYHAHINTMLLRTYAEVDDRARALGMAIKHWAKQRRINDASIGFLSSYSFILLVIYFLQRKVCLLPNLQHPELLRVVKIQPFILNGVNVSFCGVMSMAKAFHHMQLQKQSKHPAHASTTVGSLLVAFFRFYVEEFDFDRHVVSIRHPELSISKRYRWHRDKHHAWRMSIEDPLELNRDLGSVLYRRRQQQIMQEMTRALELLRAGESFEMTVCASPREFTTTTSRRRR